MTGSERNLLLKKQWNKLREIVLMAVKMRMRNQRKRELKERTGLKNLSVKASLSGSKLSLIIRDLQKRKYRHGLTKNIKNQKFKKHRLKLKKLQLIKSN
jgi:hypothetical protein